MTEQNEINIFRRIVLYIQEKRLWPYVLLLLLILLAGAYIIFQLSQSPTGGSGLSALIQPTFTLSAEADSGGNLQTATNSDGIPTVEGTPTKTRRPTSTDEYKSRFRTFTPTSDEPFTPTPFGWTASPTSTATKTPIGWTASPTKTATNTVEPTETPVPGPLTVQLSLITDDTSLDEPGGWIQYQVEVENTFTGPVEVVSLTDSEIADLSGKGTCDQSSNPYPLDLAAGDSYTCSYYVNFQGDPDDVYQNTVTLQIEDTYDRTLTVSDDVQVTINDVLPAITVSKIASSASVIEPGQYVTFTVKVNPDLDL